jgi:hypothetical protein
VPEYVDTTSQVCYRLPDVHKYLWPKQVPHPESVAGELDFGFAWFRRVGEASSIPTMLVESGF